jgi:hypothetical protein
MGGLQFHQSDGRKMTSVAIQNPGTDSPTIARLRAT